MKWFLKRTGQAFFTIWVAISFTFLLVRSLPGGPREYIKAMLIGSQAGSITAQERQRINNLVETYVNVDPDKSLFQQYIEYMGSILQGNLGHSIWYNEPVANLIAQALPWTLLIMSTAILLSFTFGLSTGALMAYVEGSRLDMALSGLFSFLTSVPYYVVAVLFVFVLAYQLQWFPTGGHASASVEPGFTVPYIVSVMRHAALPVMSIVITGAGGRALGMRGNSIRVMGEDYIRVARLRGLSTSRVALHYVGRNAVLPMYTNFMIAIGFLFGGAVILEKIFGYYGVGLLLFKAINTRDYPLMMGSFLMITVAVILGLYIADLTYGKLDPRVAAGGESQ